MIKETITYTDYNDVVRTETHYFHMNKAEITKMQMSVKGGMAGFIQRIIDTEDVAGLINLWEELIDKSYGVKTIDGKFLKRPEDLEAFKASGAYPELYMKFVTDTEAASKFINGIFPADLMAQAQEQLPAAEKAN